MQNQTLCRRLLLPALLAGALLTTPAARAQTVAAPVSLTVSDAPVQTVLRTLFAGAGIHEQNFKIDPDVQGQVNLSLSDVPFALAMRTVLGAVNPPLTYTVDNASYHVQVQKPNPAAATDAGQPMHFSGDVGSLLKRLTPGVARLLINDAQEGDSEPSDSSQDHFTKIGIKHYDAAVMADLITRQGGIILVQPNFVFPGGAGAATVSAGPATPTVTTVPSGPASPFGPGVPFSPRPAQTGPASAPAANNILPEGIKRIYALESDNSLVIDSTGTGIPGFAL